MDKWVSTPRKSKNAPPCGTVACIAGWAAVLSQQQGGETIREVASRLWNAADTGGDALEIDYDGQNRLFYTCDWPSKFREQYDAAKTPTARARVTVARIEHFIKTKGAE